MPELIVGFTLFLFVVFLILSSLKVIGEGQIGVIERLGCYQDTRGSGLHFKLPLIDRFVIINEQQSQSIKQTIEFNGIPRFEIDLQLTYKITDVKLYLYGNKNVNKAIESSILKESRLFLEPLSQLTDIEYKIELTQFLQDFLKQNTYGIEFDEVDLLSFKSV